MAKKTRRNWTINLEQDVLSCSALDFSIDATLMTPQAHTFIKLYGLKQWLSDKLAGKGKEYTQQELKDLLTKHAQLLNLETAELVRTDAGFTLRDPSAIRAVMSKKDRLLKKLAELTDQHAKLIELGATQEIADKMFGDTINEIKDMLTKLED